MTQIRRIPRPLLTARAALIATVITLISGAAWLWPPATSAPPPPQPTPPAADWALDPATRTHDWQEDIDTLTKELPRLHKNAFFKCPRADFEAAAADLRAAVPNLQDHHVVFGLMKLAAMLGDGHTGIGPGDLKPPFRSFPLSIYVFSDGPVIVAARDSQKDLIGCTLLRFGNAAADDALRRVMAGAAYENDPSFKALAPRLLPLAEIAQAAGLIDTLDRIEIVVRDATGTERTVELTPLAPGEKLATPAFDDAALPLSRRKHEHRNWFEPLPDRHALYFRFNTCADEPGLSIADLSKDMLARIDAGGIDRVIVDVRANGGGNSGLLAPFVRGLADRPAVHRPGGILVLIGRGTFSSAHMNAMELKNRLGATLLGEPTGQKPNAYGEVRTFTLPHSGLTVRYSTKFWRTEDGDRPSVDPDIPVPLSSTDYFAPRDPVLDAALSLPRQ